MREGGVVISKCRQFVLRRSIPDLNSALESYEIDLSPAKNPSTFDLIWMEKTDDIDSDMRIWLKIIFYFSGLYFILTVGATLRAQYLIL